MMSDPFGYSQMTHLQRRLLEIPVAMPCVTCNALDEGDGCLCEQTRKKRLVLKMFELEDLNRRVAIFIFQQRRNWALWALGGEGRWRARRG